MKEIFEGIFKDGKKIFTINLVPGKRVYGERLYKKDNEYREWAPNRSKLGAAIVNGIKEVPIKKGSTVLYLGASTGTTPSHISDIIGKDGILYAIEFAERVFRNLTELGKRRQNIAPIHADARKISEYGWAEECDIVFCDIADPQEVDIFILNCDIFLKKGGYGMIAIKSQSIDVTANPKDIYEESKNKMKKAGYTLVDFKQLDPHEKHHGFALIKK